MKRSEDPASPWLQKIAEKEKDDFIPLGFRKRKVKIFLSPDLSPELVCGEEGACFSVDRFSP